MSEWISVKDRLPDEKIDVLITAHELGDVTRPRFVMVAMLENGEWFDTFNYGAIYCPTHWMQLPPEPPSPEEPSRVEWEE